ncbi:unnamed protein product [Absidia cylindrospora]
MEICAQLLMNTVHQVNSIKANHFNFRERLFFFFFLFAGFFSLSTDKNIVCYILDHPTSETTEYYMVWRLHSNIYMIPLKFPQSTLSLNTASGIMKNICNI